LNRERVQYWQDGGETSQPESSRDSH